MGKRSNFERTPRDFYPTPYAAVVPLISHLGMGFSFYEPCAGDGQLIDHLEKNGLKCIGASDITPLRKDIKQINVFDFMLNATVKCNYYITNPPWDREILHDIIWHLSRQRDTWLLFDADWAHTKQSSLLIKYCKKIVSIGRVKWIPDSKMTGKDNCAWYNFGWNQTKTEFIGR